MEELDGEAALVEADAADENCARPYHVREHEPGLPANQQRSRQCRSARTGSLAFIFTINQLTTTKAPLLPQRLRRVSVKSLAASLSYGYKPHDKHLEMLVSPVVRSAQHATVVNERIQLTSPRPLRSQRPHILCIDKSPPSESSHGQPGPDIGSTCRPCRVQGHRRRQVPLGRGFSSSSRTRLIGGRHLRSSRGPLLLGSLEFINRAGASKPPPTHNAPRCWLLARRRCWRIGQ